MTEWFPDLESLRRMVAEIWGIRWIAGGSEGYLDETPNVARQYCPECEPDADPIKEILDVRYCGMHGPTTAGLDDSGVRSQDYLSGSSESGGEANRAMCDFIHRKETNDKDRAS